jgi:hypothetical protein
MQRADRSGQPGSRPATGQLQVGGLTPLTTTEYPGRLLASGVDCEPRTTWRPALIEESKLVALAGMGVRRYALQAFRPQGCNAPELGAAPALIAPALAQRIAARFPELVLRVAGSRRAALFLPQPVAVLRRCLLAAER